MRFLNALVLLAAGTASAASSWGFEDATVTVGSKKANTAATGPTFKEKYVCPLLYTETTRTTKFEEEGGFGGVNIRREPFICVVLSTTAKMRTAIYIPMTHTLFANYLPLSVLHRFTQKSPLSQSVPFGTAETLKITLTAQEKGKGKRPHQAFLILRETTTGVEAPFPLTVKENGKATLEIVRPTLTQCPELPLGGLNRS